MAKAMTLTEKSSEFDLPKELSNPTVNMESCILFGLPKCGKTTLLSKLPNCLIIDTENGILKDIFRCYDYAGCLKVDLGGDDLPIITISRDVWKKMKKDILE